MSLLATLGEAIGRGLGMVLVGAVERALFEPEPEDAEAARHGGAAGAAQHRESRRDHSGRS